MKNEIEVRLSYMIIGLAVGALIATAYPLVEHWPSLDNRLGVMGE